MSKREQFDLLVVVPLEEELQEFLTTFKPTSDRSTPTRFRYVVEADLSTTRILVIQQDDPGRTPASRAVSDSLLEFDAGVVVCLGIAGTLSGDVNLADVCYSGSIIDVYDNTKALDTEDGDLDIAFSPTSYNTPREITAAFNFIRTLPDLTDQYVRWQSLQSVFSKSLFPCPILLQGKKEITIGRPLAKNGTIVCGAVSGSENYKKKLLALDRKILAIETESGGVFEAAHARSVPALTIRGISDYADKTKTLLETETSGYVRRVAAANAATFLKLQLHNTRFLNFLGARRRALDDPAGANAITVLLPANDLALVVKVLASEVEDRLRELSPEFRLAPTGYLLPIPRIRRINTELGRGQGVESDPIEIRDALLERQMILLSIPPSYPDNSLPWVLASDLLTAEISGKQVVPIVVDAENVRPPKSGFSKVTSYCSISQIRHIPGAQLVIILENLPLRSKSRLNFLINEIRTYPDARFIFIDRGAVNILSDSQFASSLSAEVFSICDISFVQIAHFIQKNFSMTGPEAEVVALRLQDTFNQFDLSAHPTYFAGIPKETLAALLHANRRAELIQLAVDGFLTIVVAEDQADITLSRTTRSRFLRELAVLLKLEKRSFNQEQLVALTRDFASKHDFEIDPLAFLRAFIDKGILHFDADSVRFSLSFIESYLLAMELRENEVLATRYFRHDDPDFDLTTFDLYVELGASSKIVTRLVSQLDELWNKLCLPERRTHVLLTDDIRPAMLQRPERLESLRMRLRKAAEDVREQRGDKDRKQRILDIADRVRLETATMSERALEDSGKSEKKVEDLLDSSLRVWAISTVLLGSGAEHLDAVTKQSLAKNLILLAGPIIDMWTRMALSVDFQKFKSELTKQEFLEELVSKGNHGLHVEESTRLVEAIVDVLEIAFFAEPFRRVVHKMCEQARHRVLAASVEKARVSGHIEEIVHGVWLADIDSKRGARKLKKAIKQLPPARFLRVALAAHFLERVYWSQWRKEDRLALLDAADEAMKPLQLSFDKAKLKRQIERDESRNQK